MIKAAKKYHIEAGKRIELTFSRDEEPKTVFVAKSLTASEERDARMNAFSQNGCAKNPAPFLCLAYWDAAIVAAENMDGRTVNGADEIMKHLPPELADAIMIEIGGKILQAHHQPSEVGADEGK